MKQSAEGFKPTLKKRLFSCVGVVCLIFYFIYSVMPSSPPTSVFSSCDGDRLFYNRVPKCGSTTIITLMRKLAVRNNFEHHHSRVYDKKSLTEQEQRHIIQEVMNSHSPSSFDRHVFFFNFTSLGACPPLFMNVIRDPVERIISSFFYRRMVARQNKTSLKPSHAWLNKKFEHCVLTPDPECTFLDGHQYTVLQLPYFCGQEEHCQLLNDPRALARAKQNIEEFFPVVGTLEQINMTLQVLESTLPKFFRGAFEVYHTLGFPRNRNPQKEFVREEIKAILRANLTDEYELYHYVQERLRRQFANIQNEIVLELLFDTR